MSTAETIATTIAPRIASKKKSSTISVTGVQEVSQPGEQQHQRVDDDGEQPPGQAGDRQREVPYDRFDRHVDDAEDGPDEQIGQHHGARVLAPAFHADSGHRQRGRAESQCVEDDCRSGFSHVPSSHGPVPDSQ